MFAAAPQRLLALPVKASPIYEHVKENVLMCSQIQTTVSEYFTQRSKSVMNNYLTQAYRITVIKIKPSY